MRVSTVLAIHLMVSDLSECYYMKTEPPETHFFLKKNFPQNSQLFFTEPSSTKAELLCVAVEEYRGSQLEMLAHQVCTEAGFPSFTSVRKSELQVMSSSGLSCQVTSLQEILCSRQSLGRRRRRCYPVEVECGSCHQQTVASPGSSLALWSPMYPVSLPGMFCKFEVDVDLNHKVDFRLEVTDLSVGHGGDENCEAATSSIHVLTGRGTDQPLQSEVVLCGAQGEARQFSFENKNRIQLWYTSGRGREAGDRRGFQLTVSVSREKKLTSSLMIGLIVSFLLAFVLLVGLLCCVGAIVNKKKSEASRLASRPRRGHQKVNPYLMDNSVARRHPSLPCFTFYCDNSGQPNQEANQELGFKLYETISLKSSLNSYENIGYKIPPGQRLRSSLPPPPPLPARPSSVSETSQLSPIYLSISGGQNPVFE